MTMNQKRTWCSYLHTDRSRLFAVISFIIFVVMVIIVTLAQTSRSFVATQSKLFRSNTIIDSSKRTTRSTVKTANAGTDSSIIEQKMKERIRQHRVLAFGDSLTAGTSGYQTFPYAPYLEEALRSNRQHHDNTTSEEEQSNTVVRYRGLPGWTATDMLHDLDGPNTGLRSAIQAVQDPSLSLVIILVGTNDLGRGHDDQRIVSDIIQLHKICYDNGVPYTIAISIPSSGYQHRNVHAATLAQTVNAKLKEYCENISNNKTIFFQFPFPYEINGVNWHSDTLHFSQQGYKVLGESLAPVVAKILELLDQQQTEGNEK